MDEPNGYKSQPSRSRVDRPKIRWICTKEVLHTFKCECCSFKWLRASDPHWLQLALAPSSWPMVECPNARNPNTNHINSDASVHRRDAFIWNELLLSGPRADPKWSCYHYFKSEKHKEEGATGFLLCQPSRQGLERSYLHIAAPWWYYKM